MYRGKVTSTFTSNGAVHKIDNIQYNAAYVKKHYAARIASVNKAIHLAVRREYWPAKASQMYDLWLDRRSKGAVGAAGGGYPEWVPLSKKYMAKKGNKLFWLKTGRFIGWLSGVARGSRKAGDTWDVMQAPPNIRGYVQKVNDGFKSKGNIIPARPIFVVLKSDMAMLVKIIKKAIFDATHGK